MRWMLVISLVLIQTVASAQAPGYMGRRLVVAADISFMNALFNPNTNFNNGFGSFNHREGIDVDYVVSRNGSVGLTFELVNTAMKYDRWNDPKFSEPLITDVASTFDHASITGQMFGVNYKHFSHPSRGGIAPVGAFARFGVGVVRTVLTPYDLENKVKYDHSWELYTPVVTLGYGRQRILWNSIVIRTGLELGIVPTGMVPAISGNSRIEHSDPHKEMRRFHDARLFSYYMINAKFGIGFLAPFRHRPK